MYTNSILILYCNCSNFCVDKGCDNHSDTSGFEELWTDDVTEPFTDCNYSPLYSGSSVTVHCFAILLLQFWLAFRPSEKIINALLELIQLILPTPNNSFTSFYMFNKYVSSFIPKVCALKLC